MTNEKSWTETPEMEQYDVSVEAEMNHRQILRDARRLYQEAHLLRKQASEDTNDENREFHLGNAESCERQAQRKIDILHRKGVLVDRAVVQKRREMANETKETTR